MQRSLAIAVAAALWACGGGPKDLVTCPEVAGTFGATSTLQSTTGSCARAKSKSFDKLTFSKGSYQFPIPGVASCHTKQVDCDINVHCTSPLLSSAHFTFEGTLSPDGTQLSGTATFTGSYQGCSLVVYGVEAVQQ